MNDQELEVKYLIADLPALERRLQALNAHLIQARVHETNLRYDTADMELSRTARVLRLRQDRAIRLTFKGPSGSDQGVRVRQEIELTVDSFQAAKAFLEALGYQVSLMYEKYRTTYELDGVEIVLDELPYGNFAELEGLDAASIQAANRRLDLDWEARAPESYTTLFEQLKSRLELSFRDLSFENFRDLQITPSDLNLRPGDQ